MLPSPAMHPAVAVFACPHHLTVHDALGRRRPRPRPPAGSNGAPHDIPPAQHPLSARAEASCRHSGCTLSTGRGTVGSCHGPANLRLSRGASAAGAGALARARPTPRAGKGRRSSVCGCCQDAGSRRQGQPRRCLQESPPRPRSCHGARTPWRPWLLSWECCRRQEGPCCCLQEYPARPRPVL